MNPTTTAPKTLSLKDVRAVRGGVSVRSAVKAGITFQKIETNAAQP